MHHIGEDGIFVLRALRCPEGVRVEVEDHGPGTVSYTHLDVYKRQGVVTTVPSGTWNTK